MEWNLYNRKLISTIHQVKIVKRVKEKTGYKPLIQLVEICN